MVSTRKCHITAQSEGHGFPGVDVHIRRGVDAKSGAGHFCRQEIAAQRELRVVRKARHRAVKIESKWTDSGWGILSRGPSGKRKPHERQDQRGSSRSHLDVTTMIDNEWRTRRSRLIELRMAQSALSILDIVPVELTDLAD